MARAPARRALTGLRRRGAKRKHPSNSRWMHLSHKEIGTRNKVHKSWVRSVVGASLNDALLQQLLILKAIIAANIINPPNLNAGIIIDSLLHLISVDYGSYGTIVAAWIRLDHHLHDISPLEDSQPSIFKPGQHIRLSSWDDGQCYAFTSFLSGDLRRIYNLFGLANIADVLGFIRISIGHTNQNGYVCRYRIHAEELFLFFMTRCKKGFTITDMVNLIFGGDCNKWSYGWPWMIRYLDERYRNILGHQGLLRFVDEFPQYFEAIEKYVKKPKWHRNDNGDLWWSPGLANLPFWIFGFMDCSIYRSNVPYSGPHGDIVGAGRKPWYHIMQRAIYTGWKSIHGMKIETVRLPNGMSTVFGPVSCRRADIGRTGRTVHDMSGLNQFLSCIQRGRYPRKYAALGDGIYGMDFECIRSYYKAHFPQAQMTEYMRVCDSEMKACRQSIEWGYGKTDNIFSICDNADNFKLGKRNPYAIELLRVCHLLTNIYNCVNGDQSSGHSMFNCPAPSLEQYLAL